MTTRKSMTNIGNDLVFAWASAALVLLAALVMTAWFVYVACVKCCKYVTPVSGRGRTT